jgi:transposase
LREQQRAAAATPHPPAVPEVPPAIPTLRTTTHRLSPRLVTRCLAGNPPANSEADQRQVAQLCEAVPELAAAGQLAVDFRTLVTEHQLDRLAPWLERAAASPLPEFQALAASLVRDRAAVERGIATQWSYGQVEGQVNRLKLIKRMMYGRGKLDLLRKRILYRPSAIT